MRKSTQPCGTAGAVIRFDHVSITRVALRSDKSPTSAGWGGGGKGGGGVV